MLRGEVRRGQGRVIHAAIRYSDLRGSTALAESVPLETYLATLNAYYDCVIEAVGARGGDIMYGNVGSARRLDFTAMGPAVNAVCWLEALCASRGAARHFRGGRLAPSGAAAVARPAPAPGNRSRA